MILKDSKILRQQSSRLIPSKVLGISRALFPHGSVLRAVSTSEDGWEWVGTWKSGRFLKIHQIFPGIVKRKKEIRMEGIRNREKEKEKEHCEIFMFLFFLIRTSVMVLEWLTNVLEVYRMAQSIKNLVVKHENLNLILKTHTNQNQPNNQTTECSALCL